MISVGILGASGYAGSELLRLSCARDPAILTIDSDAFEQIGSTVFAGGNFKAMQRNETPVTYVLFPDEGHGFARPENSMAFNAVAEGFLGECLGGRVEPIGDDFKGSSIQVPEGAGGVKGLSAALESHTPESRK